MTMKISSTTDTAEALAQINGETASAEEPKQSASADPGEKQDETKEDSEPSEVSDDQSDETEKIEAKEDDDGEETAEEKPKKQKNGIQKRIDKLSKRAAEEAREKEFWKAEALKAKQSSEPKEEVSEPKMEAAATAGKPQVDDFDTYQEYIEALTDWKVDQKEFQRAKKENEAKSVNDFQSRIQTHREKVKSFEASHPDFKEVIEAASEIVLSPVLVDAIIDLGPEFQYELAKNQEELERINGLSAIAIAREIGKIEARIQARGETPKAQIDEKKITTKAPAPIKVVGTSSTGQARKTIWDRDLSQAEYERLRAKESPSV